jgi:hypothetical protein
MSMGLSFIRANGIYNEIRPDGQRIWARERLKLMK